MEQSKELLIEVREMAQYIHQEMIHLSRADALNLAVGIQRNRILAMGLGVSEAGPTILEDINVTIKSSQS